MKKPYFQVLTILTLLLLIYVVHFTVRSYNTTSTVDGLPWNLTQIGISGAWEITAGNKTVTTAVIDTGVDFTHPSITQTQWINTGEIPNNSVDDDKNGYIDDWKGWDWVNHDNNPGWEENDKIDHHGTFITGLIAANDDSIIGVAPNTTIMALRVVDQDTLIPNPDALKSALDYAIENGADVIIMSIDLFIGPPGFRDSIR
jgi:subtilisin family serine protease